MNHKSQNSSMAIKDIYGSDKDRLRLRRGGNGGGRGRVLCLMFTLMILIPNFCVSTEAKAIQQNKKSLKLFKSSSSSASLIELRHKRDTFANEHQPQQTSFVRDHNVYQEQIGAEDDYDYYENDDDNYDVIPDMRTADGDYPPTVADQISEKAKEVAESFTQMWQSLTDSIRHCLNAVRRLFGDDNEEYDGQVGTAEQEEELRIAMEEYYRAKNMHDNEVLMNA